MGRRRDLASLELLVRTLQSAEQMSVQSQSLEIDRKRAQLDVARLRNETQQRAADRQLSLRQLEVQAEQMRANTNLQTQQFRMQEAQLEANVASQAAGLEMQSRALLLNFFSTLENAKLNRDNYNLNMVDTSLRRISTATAMMPELRGQLLEYQAQRDEARGRIQSIFLVPGEETRDSGGGVTSTPPSISPAFQKIAEYYSKHLGVAMDPQEITDRWTSIIQKTYQAFAREEVDRARETNPNASLDTLPQDVQQRLVNRAVEAAFIGGRSGEYGILMTAAMGRLGQEKVQEIRNDIYGKHGETQEGLRAADLEFYEYMMSHVKHSNDGFADFATKPQTDTSSPLTTVAQQVTRKIAGSTRAALDSALPDLLTMTQGVATSSKALQDLGASITMDLSMTSDTLRTQMGLPTNGPKAMMDRFRSIMSMEDPAELFAAMVSYNNEVTAPALTDTNEQIETAESIDTGLTPTGQKVDPISRQARTEARRLKRERNPTRYGRPADITSQDGTVEMPELIMRPDDVKQATALADLSAAIDGSTAPAGPSQPGPPLIPGPFRAPEVPAAASPFIRDLSQSVWPQVVPSLMNAVALTRRQMGLSEENVQDFQRGSSKLISGVKNYFSRTDGQ